MKACTDDALIMPVRPEPFALLIDPAMAGLSATDIERALRHMGFRPETIDDETIRDGKDAAANMNRGPVFRLWFGELVLRAGAASDMALDLLDPSRPEISLLASSLTPEWRDEGRCWMFVPESAESAESAGVGAPPLAPRRDLFKMMLMLIDLFDATHLFWMPARLWSDAAQFRTAIAEMAASGMPPVLHLVAFRRHEADGMPVLRTRGLASVTGQELESPIPDGWTVAGMVRRLARLALDMMMNGPITRSDRMLGLEPGEWVRLEPQRVGEGGGGAVGEGTGHEDMGGHGTGGRVRVEFGRD